MSWRSQRAERPTRPGPLLPPRKILVKSIGYNSLYRRERVRRLLLALAYIVLLGILTLGRPGAAGAQTPCAEDSTAVANRGPGLAEDCTTLLGLKATLGGEVTLNWAEDEAMNMWNGNIVVSGTPARVTRLDLDSKGLTGTIPAALGDLSALRSLVLRSNSLTGVIPAALGDLSALTELYLDSNGLTGTIPAALGDLSALIDLDLSMNALTGRIPAKLGDLSALTGLNLSNNQLDGPIPTALGNLRALTGLNLSMNGLTGNGLTGTIPAELGSLSKLTYLDLSMNGLTGTIPAELGSLSKLTYLDFSMNELTGRIPAELGDLRALTVLDLSMNELTGPIPAKLGDLSDLTYLDLADNQLDGPIPAKLGSLDALTELYLSTNQLTGRIPPALGDLSALTYLDLSTNQLTGPIPTELGDLSALTYLDLSTNQLTGRIPTELGSLSALTHLYLHDTDWTVIYPVPPELLAKANANQLDLRTNRRPTAPEVKGIALTPGDLFTYRLAFSDRDGDDLTYHATAKGTVLTNTTPSSSGDLAFDSTTPTPTLSGIPPTTGSIAVTVSVTDEDSPPDPPTKDTPYCDPDREISDSEANPPPLCAYVTVIITRNALQPSTGPTIRAQVATRGQAFSYTVPAFNNLNPDDLTVTYRATQADGSALPEWLAFNTKTRTFSGTPPTEESIDIRVTATDTAYPPYTASVTFSLTVGASSGGGGGGGGRRPPPPPPPAEGLTLSTTATFVDSEIPSSANNSFYVTLRETNPTEKGGFTYRACTVSGEPADDAVRVGNCQWTEFVDNEFNLLLFTFNWKDGGTPPEGEVGTDAVWGQYCLLNEHGAGKWVRFFTPDGTADSVVGSASGNISYSGESLEFP